MALFQHERIKTTLPKAKELRPIVERLITLAKRGILSGDRDKELHARRLIMARLGPVAKAEFHDDEELPMGSDPLKKLFAEIAPRYKERKGGYTRILKISERRLGDAGVQAYIELLKEGEVKVKAKEGASPVPASPPSAPAPAPTVSK
jgi:large subunit ribosomal protein L17